MGKGPWPYTLRSAYIVVCLCCVLTAGINSLLILKLTMNEFTNCTRVGIQLLCDNDIHVKLSYFRRKMKNIQIFIRKIRKFSF